MDMGQKIKPQSENIKKNHKFELYIKPKVEIFKILSLENLIFNA